MNYSISQLQIIDAQATVKGESISIDYVGEYVMEGSFKPASVQVRIEDWIVTLEKAFEGYSPTTAKNIMTGTEYTNPWKWFSNKVSK